LQNWFFSSTGLAICCQSGCAMCF